MMGSFESAATSTPHLSNGNGSSSRMSPTAISYLPRVPWRKSRRPKSEGKSLVDYVLQPLFHVVYLYMAFSLVRLFWATIFLPTYLVLAFYRSIWPFLLRRGLLLLTSKGRHQLQLEGKQAVESRKLQGERQFREEYMFSIGTYVPGWSETHENPTSFWSVNREYFMVCGLQACVVHERPTTPLGKTVVLLHGNPSYSFMYRHIIKALVSQGFEVFALDWLGFGGSDKPLRVEDISFELHMRTLISLFESYQFSDVHVLAHDWGGCVALSTIPHLQSASACTGLMLLNSFFPPRPTDISWNSYLLYALWLCSQGVLAGLVPEEAIIRFMAPSVTQTIVSGYAAPYSSVRSKAAVTRFARMVPGMPQLVYDLFEGPLGRLFDGLCPQTTFSSLDEQLRLRRRDQEVRAFWASGEARIPIEVAFGSRDSLLGDFFSVLTDNIRTAHGAPRRHVLEGGGHYAAEETPEEIVQLFGDFALVEA